MEHNVPKHILIKRLGRLLLEHERANAEVKTSVSGFPFRQIGLVSGAEPEDNLGTEVLTHWKVGGARTSSTSISGVFLHRTLRTLISWTNIMQFDHTITEEKSFYWEYLSSALWSSQLLLYSTFCFMSCLKITATESICTVSSARGMNILQILSWTESISHSLPNTTKRLLF